MVHSSNKLLEVIVRDGSKPIQECLTVSRMVATMDGAERVVMLANSANRALMPKRPMAPTPAKGANGTMTLGQLAVHKPGGVS